MPSPATLLAAAAAALTLATTTTAQAACNGAAALCPRPYSNVTFVGSHDSAFVGVGPADNQLVSVADQLSLGVRFLQAQTHDLGGTIEMCHTSCLLEDAGPLAGFLAPVGAFLAANPDEVVTLLLTNGDGVPVRDYAAVFEAAGLEEYVFAPPNGTLALDEWPTLQEMIDAGTRLVVWMGMFMLWFPFDFNPHENSPAEPWFANMSCFKKKKTTMPTRLQCRTSWMSSRTTTKPTTT